MKTRQDSLIAFVHPPKTAGSTVNNALKKIGSGVDHIEKLLSEPAEFERVARSSAWISGHIVITDFEKIMARIDRPIRYFTTLREPTSQVRSHFNWLIEIYFKGGSFFEGHPKRIREISEDIRQSDLTNPQEITEKLSRYHGLFLNFQSKFLLGNSFDWANGDLVKSLNTFEFIGVDDDIDNLLGKMHPGLTSDRRINVSQYHFDPSIFETHLVSEFLAMRNSRDIRLYQALVQNKPK